MQQSTKDFTRCECVYAQWVDTGEGVTLLHLERVNGDCSVTEMFLTKEEVRSLQRVLGGDYVSVARV
jgi:hypothetical protein